MQIDTIELPQGKIFYVGQTPVGVLWCSKKRLILAAADPEDSEDDLRHKLVGAIARLTKQRKSGNIEREN